MIYSITRIVLRDLKVEMNVELVRLFFESEVRNILSCNYFLI
jgi:hypothetical protein